MVVILFGLNRSSHDAAMREVGAMPARQKTLWVIVGVFYVALFLYLIPSVHTFCFDPGEKRCGEYRLPLFVVFKSAEILNDYGAAISAVAAIAIAVFTLTLKRATDRLWLAGEVQTRATREIASAQAEQTREAIAQAKSAAEAASAQVEIARNSVATTERAYVFCVRIEANWTADKSTEQVVRWSFTPVWRNSGKTPTRRGRHFVSTWMATGDIDLPRDFDYADAGGSPPEDIVIGPNADMHAAALVLEVGQLDAIRHGGLRVYVHGWCDYNDVFEDTPRHRSEFCFELQVTGNPIYKEGGFRYRRHGPFNGFDGECLCPPAPYPAEKSQ